jgi:hypothetical protein
VGTRFGEEVVWRVGEEKRKYLMDERELTRWIKISGPNLWITAGFGNTTDTDRHHCWIFIPTGSDNIHHRRFVRKSGSNRLFLYEPAVM